LNQWFHNFHSLRKVTEVVQFACYIIICHMNRHVPIHSFNTFSYSNQEKKASYVTENIFYVNKKYLKYLFIHPVWVFECRKLTFFKVTPPCWFIMHLTCKASFIIQGDVRLVLSQKIIALHFGWFNRLLLLILSIMLDRTNLSRHDNASKTWTLNCYQLKQKSQEILSKMSTKAFIWTNIMYSYCFFKENKQKITSDVGNFP